MKIISICGREGAGKTTICNYICEKKDEDNTFYHVYYPELYVISIIFGWDYEDLLNDKNLDVDPVWGLTVDEAKLKILNLIRTHIDSNFKYNSAMFLPSDNDNDSEWIEYSFAEPLKKIASAIFTFPKIEGLVDDIDRHKMLLGYDKEMRNIRDHAKTINYNICGSLTGRQCLEVLGTNIFRNNFDKQVWVKLFHRKIKSCNNVNVGMVISDLRFLEEYEVLNNIGSKFLVIYTDPNDLILTEKDKLSHPAKWTFLTFINKINDLYHICNNSNIVSLYQKVDNFLEYVCYY